MGWRHRRDQRGRGVLPALERGELPVARQAARGAAQPARGRVGQGGVAVEARGPAAVVRMQHVAGPAFAHVVDDLGGHAAEGVGGRLGEGQLAARRRHGVAGGAMGGAPEFVRHQMDFVAGGQQPTRVAVGPAFGAAARGIVAADRQRHAEQSHGAPSFQR